MTIYKIKNTLRNLLFVFVFFVYSINSLQAANGVLTVNGISIIRSSAIANSSYSDGWQWLFDITLPEDEPTLRMSFSDWYNGTNTIASGGNMRYYSQYALNASTSLSAANVSGASSTYGDILIFATSSDLNFSNAGIQTTVVVDTKVPLGVTGSNYSSVYGLKSRPITVETTVDFPAGNTDSPSNYSISGGSVNNVIWQKNINIENGNAKLFNLTLKKSGSVNDGDFSNFKLKLDGVDISSAASLNASHEIVFDLSVAPQLLSMGLKSLQVTCDISNSSAGGNFRFSLQNQNSIFVEDILVSGVPLTVTSNIGGNINSISGGLISLNTLLLNTATNIKINASVIAGGNNMTIASYTMKAYNEPARINNISFSPILSSMITTDITNNNLTNVGLYINGNRIGTSQTIISGTNFTFSGLANDFIVDTLASTTVEVRADVKTINGIAYTGGNIKIDMVAANDNVSGVSSNVLRSTGYLSGQTMSISENGVQFSIIPFTLAPLATNTSSYKIASYSINTSSIEGVTIISGTITLTGSMINNINNLTVKRGETIISVVTNPNPSAGNILPLVINMSASEQVLLDVYIDILGTAASGEILNSNIYMFGQTQTSGLAITSPTLNGPSIALP